MRRFTMERKADSSGVSGTGIVLDGLVFDDGRTVVAWRTTPSSIAIYDSYKDFDKIHIESHPVNETIIHMIDRDESFITCGNCGHVGRLAVIEEGKVDEYERVYICPTVNGGCGEEVKRERI